MRLYYDICAVQPHEPPSSRRWRPSVLSGTEQGYITFPAPGVYEAEITEFVVRVSALRMPE